MKKLTIIMVLLTPCPLAKAFPNVIDDVMSKPALTDLLACDFKIAE